MSREAHVRFWESAGVQLPRATHPFLRIRPSPLFHLPEGVQELGMVGMVTPQHVLATVVPVAEVETALARGSTVLAS